MQNRCLHLLFFPCRYDSHRDSILREGPSSPAFPLDLRLCAALELRARTPQVFPTRVRPRVETVSCALRAHPLPQMISQGLAPGRARLQTTSSASFRTSVHRRTQVSEIARRAVQRFVACSVLLCAPGPQIPSACRSVLLLASAPALLCDAQGPEVAQLSFASSLRTGGFRVRGRRGRLLWNLRRGVQETCRARTEGEDRAKGSRTFLPPRMPVSCSNAVVPQTDDAATLPARSRLLKEPTVDVLHL